MFQSKYKAVSIVIVIILGIILIYNSLNFKLDASSDTLILQNDEDFKYFKYYNEIFPNKNFLVLAVKSKKIDQDFISFVNKIESSLYKIEYIDSIFTIADAPILISSNIKLNDLNKKTIPTLKNSQLDLSIVLKEFSESPIFKDQIINKNQQVSALIIYTKIDQKFHDLKKEKDLILEKQNKDSSDFKKILSQYK